MRIETEVKIKLSKEDVSRVHRIFGEPMDRSTTTYFALDGTFPVKFTENYWKNDCVVSLDQIDGFGDYVVVEGQSKEIDEILDVLGLKNREDERRSYYEILNVTHI